MDEGWKEPHGGGSSRVTNNGNNGESGGTLSAPRAEHGNAARRENECMASATLGGALVH